MNWLRNSSVELKEIVDLWYGKWKRMFFTILMFVCDYFVRTSGSFEYCVIPHVRDLT